MSGIGAHEAGGSPDRFGYEWQTYSEILPDHEEQFRRWTPHLPPEEWVGKSFLDVGCGMGRNSFWPMSYGAREGWAVDIDERSLAQARRNLSRFPAAHVLQASAYDLPFADHFDIVFSIGVIHHLEQPQKAIAGMVRAVRPGGRVLIWVYGREGNRWLLPILDPLRRVLLSRMPIGILHHLALYPAIMLWFLLRLGVRRNEYFRMLAGFRFGHLRSIVFDQMLPRIAHYWPRQSVRELMEKAGLSDVRLASVNGMSWSAIGIRPLHPERPREE